MEQTYCRNCNAPLENGCAFCSNCGTPVNNADQQPQYVQAQYTQPQYAQPQYNQPQYAQPQYNQPQYGYNPQPYVAPIGNGPGTAGMVLGIISAAMLLFSWIPILGLMLGVVCMILAVPGMALSIAGMCRRNCPKGRAIAGLVLNTFGIVIAMLITLASL